MTLPICERVPDESEGHQVLLHLQGIVAWYAAAAIVLNGKITKSLVRLVEVALTKLGLEEPELMISSEGVIQEFLSRYPASSLEAPRLYRGYN